MSHPADTVVSKLNNDAGSTAVQAARELGMKGIMLCFIINPIFIYKDKWPSKSTEQNKWKKTNCKNAKYLRLFKSLSELFLFPFSFLKVGFE